jgi:hypothetical protein
LIKQELAKQLFTYLFHLRSTRFSLAITCIDDIVAFGVEYDEGMSQMES